jgi:hypothetical protein
LQNCKIRVGTHDCLEPYRKYLSTKVQTQDEQCANHKPSQEDNEHIKTCVCKIAPQT